MFFLIILVILLFLFFIFLLEMFENKRFLVNRFLRGSCVVVGHKGFGKDLLFHTVANSRPFKKMGYVGNINYFDEKFKDKFANVSLKDYVDQTLGDNTFEDFINGTVKKTAKNAFYESKDYILSDAGVYLPSHFDAYLSKKYKGLPLIMAISRHLYNSNMHFNTQVNGRVWLKVREHGDSYFKALGLIRWTKFFGYVFVRVRFYQEYKSVENGLLPMKVGIFNKFNKALYEEFTAKNGVIRDFLIPIRLKSVRYDTRYFHELLFGEKSPTSI